MNEQKFSFGAFALDVERKLLLKDGAPLAVGQRGLLLLEALLQAGGKAVSKADLMDVAWPSQQVEENNLSVQIAGLRKLLGPGPGGEEWIATVARVGYRFIGANTAGRRTTDTDDKPPIAVLPFETADDSDQRLFGDGVGEDIINGLSRFSSLTVIARHSSFRFRAAADMADAARQLRVRYLVTGSLRVGGGRLRLSVQLVEAATARQLWSGRFDRDAKEHFAVQDEVVQLIVASLSGHIENLEIRSAMTRPTESLEAYGCLLRGIEWLRSYGEDVNRKAIAMFENAIALDPAYGLAHGYLALALLVEHDFESSPQPVKDRALCADADRSLTAARVCTLSGSLLQL